MRHAPLAALLALAACADDEILHGLDERQANEVLVALDERGVAARKVREEGAEERWRVAVAPADAARAQRILADRELPRARPAGFAEVFAKGSMVPTPTEEHALYLHALGGELSRTVAAIDGVVEARVHLGVRQADPLRTGERPAPRGAVLVKCRAPACASVRALEPGLRTLVAGAVDGLDPAAVSVLVTEAAESAGPPPASRPRSRLLAALAAGAALAAAGVAVPVVRARRRDAQETAP